MKLDLTRAQISQLLSYAYHRDEGNDGGWYYGNKSQFEARHKAILDALYYALHPKRSAAIQPEGKP